MFITRTAHPEDTPAIVEMLQASAVDQGFPASEVIVDSAALAQDMFETDPPRCSVLLATEPGSGSIAGLALYFFTFSTWVSRNGLYLEDLYVRPDHRRKGAAALLIGELAVIATARECRRFYWMVHSRNQGAIAAYQALGAKIVPDWSLMAIPPPELAVLAEAARTTSGRLIR